VEGELWMVHSGGFYRVEKQLIGPGQMPKVLHWFKWEAMLTALTGGLLLMIVYYLQADTYLVDPAVSAISPRAATLLSVSLLVFSWLVYDAVWRSPLGRIGWPATAVSFLLLGGLVYGLTRVLSGRAAYIHVGAIMGTIMVTNVWARILPAQQRMIDATRAGQQPDLSQGLAAKRRSMHNSYMTLPVLFIMLSNHFPATWGSPRNWLVLVLLIVAGAAARQVMIGKTAGARNWALLPVVGSLAGAVLIAAPGHRGAGAPTGSATGAASFAQARAVINQRCLPCHSQYPTDGVFTTAPAGVTFDMPEQIVRLAGRIRERAVVQRTMPFANKTGITDAERAVLARWIDGGAGLR
jgi:uncharacterized membrane protein